MGIGYDLPETEVFCLPFLRKCIRWTTCQRDKNTYLLQVIFPELDTRELQPIFDEELIIFINDKYNLDVASNDIKYLEILPHVCKHELEFQMLLLSQSRQL